MDDEEDEDETETIKTDNLSDKKERNVSYQQPIMTKSLKYESE